jgi:O-antigen/teichoic acid export membrane protein
MGPEGSTSASHRSSEAETSLTQRVVSGVNWSAGSRLLIQLLQFGAGIILARLLVPADFGLIASVYVIYGFAILFFEMGLGSSLVHQRDPSDVDKSTVFWINIIGGILLAVLLAAAGPAVASFYDSPDLVWLTPLIGLSFTLSFGVVHNALLQRALRFRVLAAIDLSAATVGTAATIVAAAAGAGAYSLALGPICTSLLSSLLSVMSVRWRPRNFISWVSLRRLWTFSGGILGFNVVNYWGRNADNLLIGRLLGIAPLGYYNRAYTLMLLPISQLSGAFGRVMFPALAAMGDDPPRVRRGYLRSVRVMNAATIPILLGIAATADGLVPLLWGPRWDATIPLLQILCLAGIPQCLSTSVGWIYQSQGRTGLMFRMGLLGSVVGVAAIVIGLHWGVTGVAWAVLARYWMMMPIGLAVAGKCIGLRLRSTLRNSTPILISAVAMAAMVYGTPRLTGIDIESPAVLSGQVILGVVVYLAGLALLDRSVLAELHGLARRRMPS